MNDKPVLYDILKELFNISMAKAADTLSFFVNNKIYIEDLNLSIANEEDASELLDQIRSSAAVLETKLQGDYSGSAFLVFSKEDVKNFFKAAHPIDPNSGMEDALSKEFLLETDNIVTASVITELSNMLNINILGGVPVLLSPDDPEMIASLSQKVDPPVYLKVAATYRCAGMIIEPQFIWLIDDLFLDKLKEYATLKEAQLQL